MALLNQWIDNKLAEIANKLPTLLYQDVASFDCGYNMGYKQCLLDLENFFEECPDCEAFRCGHCVKARRK